LAKRRREKFFEIKNVLYLDLLKEVGEIEERGREKKRELGVSDQNIGKQVLMENLS